MEISSPRSRPIDAVFVASLAFAARSRGARISPADIAIGAGLSRRRPNWTQAEIEEVLAAAMIHRPQDRPIFASALASMFEEREPRAEALTLVQPPSSNDFPPPRPAPPEPFWSGFHRLVRRMRRRLSIALYMRLRLPVRHLREGIRIVAAVIVALAGAVIIPALIDLWRNPKEPINEMEQRRTIERPEVPTETLKENESTVRLLDAFATALAIGGLGLLVWRARALARLDRPSGVWNAKTLEQPPPAPIADDSAFRVGTLGGEPPNFLVRAVGVEIAEMLGYRLGDPDLHRLDTRRTLEAQLRGGDPSLLVWERRRELPEILLLVDRTGEARFWNTLDEDFARVLAERGVAVEKVEYPGGFYLGGGWTLRPRPEVALIEAAIAAPGWTVTAVFGEAHRLGRADLNLLGKAAENGPLLFLDGRDQALWDGRHASLKAMGVSVLEATAAGLHDGLARIFAPDVGVAPDRPISRPPKRRLPPVDAMIDALGPEGQDWASDCALVEPVSFALAEQLRCARQISALGQPFSYPTLATPHPSLAFSRLAALPGSWVGPEGLRFEPPTRRRLLNRFAERVNVRAASALRAAEIVDAAFKEASPLGTSATAVHAYARALARIYGPEPDEALSTILDAETFGLLQPAPIADFRQRLRWAGTALPQDVERGEIVLLPREPRSAELRVRLAGTPGPSGGGLDDRLDQAQHATYRSHGAEITAARWALGLPSIRIQLSEPPDIGTLSATEGLGQAAFLSDGRHLLLGFTQIGGRAQLHLFDILLGTLRPVAMPLDFDGIATLTTARDAPIAVIGSRRGEWLLLRLDRAALELSASLQPTYLREVTQILDSQSEALPGSRSRFVEDASPNLSEEVRRTDHRAQAAQLLPSPAAFDAAGRFLFISGRGRREILRCDLRQPEAAPTVWYGEVPVTALACSGDNVLVGLEDGRVQRQSMDASGLSPEPLAATGTAVAAVTLLQAGPEPTGRDAYRLGLGETLVVGGEDGRILVHDGERALSEIVLRTPPRRLVGFTETAASVSRLNSDQPQAMEPAPSITLAALGRDGHLEILGMPVGNDAQPLFTPMSLLDAPLGAKDVRKHVVGLAGQSRRVAIVAPDPISGGIRLEVRPVVLRARAPEAETGGASAPINVVMPPAEDSAEVPA